MEHLSLNDLQLGSAIYAIKPGDGSAREQAASCQRVLGGTANFAQEYATKRYRSNLINWGILPFIVGGESGPGAPLQNGDYIFIPGIAEHLRTAAPTLDTWIIRGSTATPHTLTAPTLTTTERETLLAGSLINLNKKQLENREQRGACVPHHHRHFS
jgi:aconitate hydratase